MKDIDVIIYRHLSGAATEDEKRELIQFLEESEDNRKYYASAAVFYGIGAQQAKHSYTKKIMKGINFRIDMEDGRIVGQKGSKALKWLAAMAASAAVIAGVVLLNHKESAKEATPLKPTVYENVTADILPVLLSDSTKVWLGQNSTLSYIETSESRHASLTGNAYFNVRKDSSRAFVVNAGELDVKVLGTIFSVAADTAAKEVTVVLEQGAVRLQNVEGVPLVRLSANQSAKFSGETGDISVENLDAAPYMVMHYNKIVLPDASISDIARHISEMYNVRVTAVSGVKTNTTYDLNYKRTDSLEQLLEIVHELTGATLEVEAEQ